MWHLTHDMWHVTLDMWDVTHEMWHVTHDMWYATCQVHAHGDFMCLQVGCSRACTWVPHVPAREPTLCTYTLRQCAVGTCTSLTMLNPDFGGWRTKSELFIMWTEPFETPVDDGDNQCRDGGISTTTHFGRCMLRCNGLNLSNAHARSIFYWKLLLSDTTSLANISHYYRCIKKSVKEHSAKSV